MKYYQRVCIVGTTYSFLLYLLYSTEEEIKNTFFFVSKNLASLLKNNDISYCYFTARNNLLSRMLFKIILRRFAHLKWGFLKTAKIFGQDHIQFFPGLVANRNYTLIEDAPLFFSNYTKSTLWKDNQKTQTGFWNYITQMLYGSVFAYAAGQNLQCEDVIFTKQDDTSFLTNTNVTFFDMDKAWLNSSESKRNLILHLFRIDFSAPIFSNKKSIIVFTQPFSSDMPNFSEQEQIELYRKIINDYDKSDVVLKKHPRDTIDYSIYFPDIEIIDNPAPMQLLNMLGLRFKKAVTVFSSAIDGFSYELEKIKTGTSCNKKIEDYFGSL